MDPDSRGEVFAERAAAIKDPILKIIEEPTIDFVKACVMLAFYNLTAGKAGPGAGLTSVCVRFAYDLGLDAIDEDYHADEGDNHPVRAPEDVNGWVSNEELRRLWWAIYELDCAVCTFSCQPYGIERGGIKVFLPASDHHWFNNTPIGSSYLNLSSNEAWKSLQGSPNQSPRAWYLVTNYLKSCLADAARQSRRQTLESQADFETALACLKLSLPSEFQLRCLNLDDSNFGDGNWVISTNFMLLS